MLDLSRPRIVIVTRKTRLQVLLERHGTLGQARFFMASRSAPQAKGAASAASAQSTSGPTGAALVELEETHQLFVDALATVQRAIPAEQRQVRIERDTLDRFVFEPGDLVVIVGQDGLVPNAAKYLSGQLAVGFNPDPLRYEGVLCPNDPAHAEQVFQWMEHAAHDIHSREQQLQGQSTPMQPVPLTHGGYTLQQRTMALATREDGQRLLALNEVFVGHQSHQSARYLLNAGEHHERQSSSGIICSTGTGSTGWGRSLARQLDIEAELPAPEESRLIWFVREPWPSVATGAKLRYGSLTAAAQLTLRSELGEGGVVFADGIEGGRLDFLEGETVTLGIAPQRLNLVVPAVH
jgi:hypothetical protein